MSRAWLRSTPVRRCGVSHLGFACALGGLREVSGGFFGGSVRIEGGDGLKRQ
jgi:hypothetical protein